MIKYKHRKSHFGGLTNITTSLLLSTKCYKKMQICFLLIHPCVIHSLAIRRTQLWLQQTIRHKYTIYSLSLWPHSSFKLKTIFQKFSLMASSFEIVKSTITKLDFFQLEIWILPKITFSLVQFSLGRLEKNTFQLP